MTRYADWVTEPSLLFVVSGPSGVGKTSLCCRLVEELDDGVYSISATTRPMRPGETQGAEYFFKTDEEFEALKDSGGLVEWARVHENQYGTPRAFVEEQLAAGRVVVLNIDVQGGVQVMENFPDGVFVFILPPSRDELVGRISNRGEDTDEAVKLRMRNAPGEIVFAEKYQYVVVNDDLEECVSRLKAIALAERSHRGRCYRPKPEDV
jgi:guanylate kinase